MQDYLATTLAAAERQQQIAFNKYTFRTPGSTDLNTPTKDVIKFDIEETIELCESFIRADEARQQAKYAVYVDDDAFPDAFNHQEWEQNNNYGIAENEFHIITAQHAFKKLEKADRVANAMRKVYEDRSMVNAAQTAFKKVM